MNTEPLVSIVTGFFNAERFIQEAIESVIAQTYDRWELLLVDDGSNDESSKIAKRYNKEYPGRIRYLEHSDHQNRGVCASRNAGIHHARGEYIAILDADDVWLPHKLTRQVEILNAYPEAGMVFGASKYWHSLRCDSDDQRDFVPPLGLEANKVFHPPDLVALCYPLGKAPAPCPSNILLRRSTIESAGGFEEHFRGTYQLYEDQAFLIKVYLTTPVFVADECWDKYRQHPDSCMAKTKEHASAMRLYFLNWLGDYLSKQPVVDPGVRTAFEKALWPYRHPILHRAMNRSRQFKKKMEQRLRKTARRTLPVK